MELKVPNKGILFLDKNIGRFHRVIFRLKMRLTGEMRPSSYPYITGDSFRALADHLYDETYKLSPESVQRGDIVFVSNPLMREYLETAHPRILNPYVLIQHNGDLPVDESITNLLDKKIVRFYAQNVAHAHDTVVPIPIGIENRHYHVNGVIPMYERFRKALEALPPIRQNRIFFKFSIDTNPEERGPARAFFLSQPLMDTIPIHLSSKMHARILMTYKFVASPRGNSIESSRTWEALYLKTVPIVKDYPAMVSFAAAGLPLWVIRDWKELEGLTPEDLARKYDTLIENASWDPLHMNYWIGRIRADQKLIRSLNAPHTP